MTFEEFKKATPQALTDHARACFERANNPGMTNWEIRQAALTEAQFYMQELDRRHGSWTSLRDLILEIVVIVLIGGEIWLGAKQGRDEDRLMDKQNGILSTLQNSASDTASTMKGLSEMTKAMGDSTSASAKTLLSLRATTETMNKGIHDQISLFYDPSLAIVYAQDQNRLQFLNTGRTGLTLVSLIVDGVTKNLGGSKLIAGNTTIYAEIPEVYNSVAPQLPKGFSRTVPVQMHIENEVGKTFVVNGALYFVWENDKVTVHAQTSSVQPEP